MEDFELLLGGTHHEGGIGEGLSKGFGEMIVRIFRWKTGLDL